MICRLRAQAPWWAVGLVLLLPALGGGFSLLLGWPQATFFFTLILAWMLTAPGAVRRLPWWYWLLGGSLAALALLWLWPGESLLFLSPNRRLWPGPDGSFSGVAADRVSTREALFQALGFMAVLGIALVAFDRPGWRRLLMRWMAVCIALTMAFAVVIHFWRVPIILLPDVPVLYWQRLSVPFTGANLGAAFFGSCLPFGIGIWMVHSTEERYLPVRRVWQLIGAATVMVLLSLQVMTQNRWMWIALAPFLAGGLTWYLLRKRSRGRRLRTLALVAVFFLVLGLFLSLFDPGRVIERFVLLIESEDGDSNRVLIWRNAWNTFAEYPWVGVGLGGFGEVCPTTAPEGIYKWPRYAHSEPMQWLAETGLVGTALLAIVMGGMALTVWRQIRRRDAWLERIPFALAALLILSACLVDFPLRCPALLFLFALYLGVVLSADRSAEELAQESRPTPAAEPVSSPVASAAMRWRGLAGWAAAVIFLVMGVVFLPLGSALFDRGLALSQYHAVLRKDKQSQDAQTAMAAAERLLAASHRQTRWSAEALSKIISGQNNPEQQDAYLPVIEAVLADCPYHDSLYYFQAMVALNRSDFTAAAQYNAKARTCASTNRRTLRKIAELDWFLVVYAANAEERRTRLMHAQETTRWLLENDPELLFDLAQGCREQLEIPLDEFLPAIPANWSETAVLSRVCLEADRPLTALGVIAEQDLHGQKESQELNFVRPEARLTRWDLALLATTGQAQAMSDRLAGSYLKLPTAARPGMVADVRMQGWGVLNAQQWDNFTTMVEGAMPDAMERYELGRLYQKLGAAERAHQCWLTAYKSKRTPQVAAALALFYRERHAWAAALEFAMDGTHLDDKDPNAWRLLAIVALEAKDFATAKTAFDRYKTLAPARAEADFSLHGAILQRTGAAPGGKP